MAVRGNSIRNWVFNLVFAAAPAVLTALVLFAFARLLLDAIGVAHVPGDDDGPSFDGVLGVFIVLTIRALMRGVEVSDTGCRMRFVFVTKRVPWAEINGFEVAHLRNDEGPDRYKCRYERFDGQRRGLPLGSWSAHTAYMTTKWLEEQRRVLDRSKG
jgi:hypothetical protein